MSFTKLNFLALTLLILFWAHPTLADSQACLDLFTYTSIPGLTRLDQSSDGSTGGHWYRDVHGQRWYVKTDVAHRDLQTSAEVMGALIYKHFGYSTPIIKKSLSTVNLR